MLENNNIYSKLGVSSKKEDVHGAIQFIDKGIFPGAFCKIVEDVAGRKDYCSVFHADGAGTKSSLAYMYYKETGDISVFQGIVRDAIVMNIDDILCVGATGDMFLSNTIGRNKKLISGEIIKKIIKEYHVYSTFLNSLGLKINFCGGETADVGDLVNTLIIDASVFTTIKKEEVIDASNIKSNDVIVGLASYGKASFEGEYNSGIGSNGLTLARHGILHHEYYKKYPECYDRNLGEKKVFFGKYRLTDTIKELNLTVGKALLSPTRTYAPVLIEILKEYRNSIHGITHNTSGGHYKALNFGKDIKYIKDQLFQIPKIFELIQESSGTSWEEMYQVFNMGDRMDILCDKVIAKDIIKIANKYKIDSKIIGHCEESPKKNCNILEINSEFGTFSYKKVY